MPGKIKIRIIGARNLPIMDRGSDSTDAFVEVRLGANNHDKTHVCKHSLDPEWDTRFVFEVEEDEIQEEPLQIRVFDHDTYSSHDSIGKVYIDLKPLLNNNGPSAITGWFPIYDTLHGIRGDIRVHTKLELFNDFNEYRKSSSGVQFFCSSKVPEGYILHKFCGFVEELVVNDDPEYQWIDKIRTPRTSNEARQKLFSKLSGEVQRRIGLKVLDLDANCVLGYLQNFDLEGEHGIVVRGIGTAAYITKCVVTTNGTTAQLTSSPNSYHSQQPNLKANFFNETQPPPAVIPSSLNQPSGLKNDLNESLENSLEKCKKPLQIELNSVPCNSNQNKLSPARVLDRTHSESDLNSYTSPNQLVAQNHIQQQPPQQNHQSSDVSKLAILDKMEYPFLTIQQYPSGFIKSLCGMVSARSVKLLSASSTVDDLNIRDDWLIEIRNEIRSHMKALDCHVVLGYTETKSICEDVCVISASGTAAVVDENFYHSINFSTAYDPNQPLTKNCHLCHVPYSENDLPFPIALHTCRVCGQGLVPDIIFTSIHPVSEIEVIGQGCLLRASVTRPHKKSSGESSAKIVSDYLPFMEYELHRQLVGKLKIKGMNMLYGLRFQISIGENLLLGFAEATACLVAALPAPMAPKIMSEKAEYTLSEKKELEHLRSLVEGRLKRNKEFYNLNSYDLLHASPNELHASTSAPAGTSIDQQQQQQQQQETRENNDSKALFKIELDDIAEKDSVLLLLDMAHKFKEGLYCCSTEIMPGISKFNKNLQMFTSVFRCEASLHHMNTKRFNEICDDILQSLFYKFRKFPNCCLSNLSFDNSLYDDDHAMIIITGCCMTFDKLDSMPNKMLTINTIDQSQSLTSSSSTIVSIPNSTTTITTTTTTSSLTGTTVTKPISIPSSSISSSSSTTNPFKSNSEVEITTLSYVPNSHIDVYLGNINLFLIRESTQIKESGGLSGFMHCFISEMLALARSHVLSLGGNALVSFKMNECILLDNPHRNQGQCLLNVAGDAVSLKRH